MSYLLVSSFLLFVPGYCLTVLANLDRFRLLLSVSLSYTLFVLLLKTTQQAGMGIVVFEWLYFSSVVLLIAGAAIKIWLLYPVSQEPSSLVFQYLKQYKLELLSIISIAVLLALYYSRVGPYLEVPADVFRHLEFIKQMSGFVISSVQTGSSIPDVYIGVNGKFWHLLYVMLNRWSGSDFNDSILAAIYLNNLIFLLGTFYFSRILFNQNGLSDRRLLAVSLAVTSLFFLYYGVNIFSFIRYYALAPVMLNMVLYFTIMAIVIQFFRENEWRYTEIFSAILIFIATTLIHKQESLFVVVMVLLMSGYYFMMRVAYCSHPSASGGQSNVFSLMRDKAVIVFLPLLTATALLYVYSVMELRRNKPETPKLLPVDQYLPFLGDLYILNPAYQFYYVLTLWGLAVLLLFLLYRKHFKGNAFIIAGVLSPIFTVFNPWFVDLFLHHSYSIMLWRLSFLVPVCFIGGYLFVISIINLKERNAWGKLFPVLTLAALIGFLFPIHTSFMDAPYSRFETLKAVRHHTSPALWADMLDYLDTIDDKKIVITDPVTGYMVSALTKHYSYRAKFHRMYGGYIDFNFKDFSLHPFDKYAGRLLIINQRNGAISRTGRIARHWPANILQVGNYYQMERLGPYIESEPERFELLWEGHRIRVYMIHKPDNELS